MAKLYFRYGAMGSSKSANILMVRYNYEERGQYAVLLKPRTDNRDGEHEIKSRIGLEAPAEYVDEFLKEISETWSADSGEYRYHGKKVDAVLIDEAQFLSPEEVDTPSRTIFPSAYLVLHCARLPHQQTVGTSSMMSAISINLLEPGNRCVWKSARRP